MRFVFGYAGIPPEIYDAVYTQLKKVRAENSGFVSEPLRSKDQYSEADANFFLKAFAKLIQSDHQNALRDTGFILVYVKHDPSSTARFTSAFFPFMFCVGVEWTLD